MTDLHRITTAYMEAVDFTEGDSSDWSDMVIGFHASMEEQARADCADFLSMVESADLDTSEIADDTIGIDLWLTRNGHGAGFWDRGLGRLGDQLSDLAKSLGSCDVYEGDDHWLYFS